MPKQSIKQQVIDFRVNISIAEIQLIEYIAVPDHCHEAIDEEIDDLREDLTNISSSRRGDELHVPKYIHCRDNVLCCFDDGRFLQMLRVSKGQFARRMDIFSNDIAFQCPSMNVQQPVDLQLAIVLYRLGSSGVSAAVQKPATTFGVRDGGTLTKITERVFSAILKKMPNYVYWPNPAERRQLVAHKFDDHLVVSLILVVSFINKKQM